LSESKALSASGLVSYRLERWNVTVGYGHDASDWTGLSVTKTRLEDDAVQYDPENRWERNQDDALDWATLGFTVKLVPDKVQLSADLGWSHYEGEMTTVNPGTPTVNSATAYDFQDFVSDFFTGKLGIRWSVRRDLDLLARYWFEPYALGDWQWDNVQPYMQGVVQETGAAPDVIRDANVNRLLFVDSRYSDYTVNAFAVAVAAHF
jgi:hypothetical protein